MFKHSKHEKIIVQLNHNMKIKTKEINQLHAFAIMYDFQNYYCFSISNYRS